MGSKALCISGFQAGGCISSHEVVAAGHDGLPGGGPGARWVGERGAVRPAPTHGFAIQSRSVSGAGGGRTIGLAHDQFGKGLSLGLAPDRDSW
jgi:hypothetical protein